MTTESQNQPRLAPKRGDEDFAVFRENGIYYADKTQYLKPSSQAQPAVCSCSVRGASERP